MEKDTELFSLIRLEEERQAETINLIASENYVSGAVRRALGSKLTNRYSEGYPGKRYYAGNKIIDDIEELARVRALSLFKLKPSQWQVNVQPYSGSPANFAVYAALVPPSGRILGLRLNMGGHLTHGHRASFTSQLWEFTQFDVDRNSGMLHYDAIGRLAKKIKPELIVVGFSAYSRIIAFPKIWRIANAVGARVLVDMSHFAGLVAGRVYPSPFPYAHMVTTTTHKTLRGPRGAMIFSRNEFSPAIDRALFPGLQGGPHNHQTAAIAVALGEAMKPAFRTYAKQVKKNAATLAKSLMRLKWAIVTRGTDSHLFLMDLSLRGLNGREAEELLEQNSIIVNKNTIPHEAGTPRYPSGIRLGTAAVTTRGMREKEMDLIAQMVHDVLSKNDSRWISKEITTLTKRFPIP